MRVELESGVGTILPDTGDPFDPAEIPEAIRKAGFDPGEIRLVVVGEVVRDDEVLIVELGGKLPRLVLQEGRIVNELEVGRRLRLTGLLEMDAAQTRAPRLEVESWEVPTQE